MPSPELTDPVVLRLSMLPGAVFGVLDGAAFDDVQGMLSAAGLDFRPLYLDEAADAEVLATGPHLVPCPSNYAIERLREIAAEGGIVWWVWPKGEKAAEEIYKHLRGIGKVEIPTDRPDAPPRRKPVEGEPPIPGFEAVLFRHGDPKVMEGLIPLLNLGQRSRLFGQAKALLFDRGTEKPLYAPRDADFPPTPSGLIRITSEQYEKLAKPGKARFQQDLIDFLKETSPENTQGKSDAELRRLCAEAEVSGVAIGFRKDKSFGMWALLALITGGHTMRSDTIKKHFDEADDDPDNLLEDLCDEMIDNPPPGF